MLRWINTKRDLQLTEAVGLSSAETMEHLAPMQAHGSPTALMSINLGRCSSTGGVIS
jgi:hypothetical protein